MPEVFEEERKEDRKKKELAKPETKAPIKKPPELKEPETLKTIREIRDIRETVRRGREIVARKKGEYIESQEDEKDLKHTSIDVKSMLEPSPPPAKPKPKIEGLRPLELFARNKPKMSEIEYEAEESRKGKKQEFDAMMQKMKKFLK